MPLNPLLRELMERARTLGPISSLTVEQIRHGASELTHALRHHGVLRYEVGGTQDIRIPVSSTEMPARIYSPKAAGHKCPIIVFFHGGGWVQGDLESYDDMCRALSSGANAIVVAVHYRRAPEHRFPTAVDDCLAAAMWAHLRAAELGGDDRYLFVAGDGAGGGLAAVVAQDCVLADAGVSLAGQILLCPLLDHPSAGYPSYANLGPDYNVARDVECLHWFASQYLGSTESSSDRRFAPLRAESMIGLSPALIITAQHDPLRDEAEAYAHKLRLHDVDVIDKRYEGVNHSFFLLQGLLPAADQALNLISQWVASRCLASWVRSTGLGPLRKRVSP